MKFLGIKNILAASYNDGKIKFWNFYSKKLLKNWPNVLNEKAKKKK